VTVNVMWFRRDLRLRDNPALLAAAGQHGFGDEKAGVVPLFVVDPALWKPAGEPRRAQLVASLRALSDRIGGAGVAVRRGDPVHEVVLVAKAVRASAVHAAADFGPYGRRRDEALAKALAEHGIEFVRTGSPYAVAPGRLHTKAGTPLQVFTPFFRAWLSHGWRDAAPSPHAVEWVHPPTVHDLPGAPGPMAPAGEEVALRRWRKFRDGALADYAAGRNRPGIDGTSDLSTALKYGELHPRTLLADLAEREGESVATFRKELAWREFHADILFHRPQTAREYLRPEFARMPYDQPGEDLAAWQQGRTGFPMVDAGLRQLLHTGWMHNRVRMIVASFLVKDLHLEWQHGARWFMQRLRDGDLASNSLNWQWVAGCGADAAPYFRVFNPTTQGNEFDPDGAYVKRWVPEVGGGNYPEPMLDHAAERVEALRRYEAIR
jgi:deoxyribodipyrimidine photo-lyase